MGVIQRRGRYGAKLVRGGRQIWLGTFASREDAEQAIEETRARYPGWTQFPGFHWDLMRPDAGVELRYRDALRNDPCVYCGASTDHLDHIEAVSRGGEDGWANLTSACVSCNQSKKDLSLLGFLLKRNLRRDLAELTERLLLAEKVGLA